MDSESHSQHRRNVRILALEHVAYWLAQWKKTNLRTARQKMMLDFYLSIAERNSRQTDDILMLAR